MVVYYEKSLLQVFYKSNLYCQIGWQLGGFRSSVEIVDKLWTVILRMFNMHQKGELWVRRSQMQVLLWQRTNICCPKIKELDLTIANISGLISKQNHRSNLISAIYRYHVQLEVKDHTDSSEFVLWDREAFRWIKKSAVDVK